MVTSLDPFRPGSIFGLANMETPSAVDVLTAVAEPTRLRILNCLAAAPLFVSDLQDVLELPQPTVSRHLTVLRKAELVRDTSVAPFVLYRLSRDAGPQSRLIRTILDSLGTEADFRSERARALAVSRNRGRSEAKR
ncbi:MAG: metalloregulator ArsR/SmtB family transcription factor [Gemmatimonadales bacterium]